MERRTIESFFFLALLLGTLSIVAAMILPYASVLILAAVLAFLFSPLYRRLAALMHNRTLAALSMTLAMLVTILLPLTLATYRTVQEASALYGYLRSHTSPEALQQVVTNAQTYINRVAPGATIDSQQISDGAQRILSWFLGQTGALFSGFWHIVLGFLLVLLFFFYLIRDGEHLKRRAMDLSPLSDAHEEAILSRITRAITATVRGSIIMAFLQGLVSSVGFIMFGVPNPAIWGTVVVFASFIPNIGTTSVQIALVIFLSATGHLAAALGLAIWAATAVGLLDNVLGPKLMAGGARLHPLIMLIAVLGGITFFGPIGLLLGPILVALLFALFDIYLGLIQQRPV